MFTVLTTNSMEVTQEKGATAVSSFIWFIRAADPLLFLHEANALWHSLHSKIKFLFHFDFRTLYMEMMDCSLEPCLYSFMKIWSTLEKVLCDRAHYTETAEQKRLQLNYLTHDQATDEGIFLWTNNIDWQYSAKSAPYLRYKNYFTINQIITRINSGLMHQEEWQVAILPARAHSQFELESTKSYFKILF